MVVVDNLLVVVVVGAVVVVVPLSSVDVVLLVVPFAVVVVLVVPNLELVVVLVNLVGRPWKDGEDTSGELSFSVVSPGAGAAIEYAAWKTNSRAMKNPCTARVLLMLKLFQSIF